MKRIAIPTLALFALAACNDAPPAEAPAVDAEAILAEVFAVQDQQVVAFDSRGDPASFYADDAVFIGDDMPVLTGAEIGAAFAEWMKDANAKNVITGRQGWVSASGDMATTISDYDFNYTDKDGQKVTVRGANQSLWRKEGDTWKLVADSNTHVTPDAAPDSAAEATPEAAE